MDKIKSNETKLRWEVYFGLNVVRATVVTRSEIHPEIKCTAIKLVTVTNSSWHSKEQKIRVDETILYYATYQTDSNDLLLYRNQS